MYGGLSQALIARGYDLISGGTDNHLVLVNLKSKVYLLREFPCPWHSVNILT